MLCAPSGQNDAQVKVDLNSPPEPANLLKVSGLKRNMMAAVFARAFDAALQGQAVPLIELDYRSDETMWIQVTGDRVVVIFSVHFKVADDLTYGKVFLSEFSKNISGAPSCDTKLGQAPLEIASAPEYKKNAPAYVSFLLENRHIVPQKRDATINGIFQFRTYLHYHIKCNKANLHIKMRKRVVLLLQILNRAKQEPENSEKKVASGRTFVRKKN